MVTYVPENAFLVYDGTSDSGASRSGSVSNTSSGIKHVEDYRPEWRMNRELWEKHDRDELVSVSIQLFDTGDEDVDEDLQALFRILDYSDQKVNSVQGSIMISAFSLPASKLVECLALETVVAIEEMKQAVLAGEMSAMVVANQTKIVGGKEVQKNRVEDGTYYTNWMANKFTANGINTARMIEFERYPIVTIVDDGVDNGGSSTTRNFSGSDRPDSQDLMEWGEYIPGYNDSRMMYSFRFDWRGENYDGTWDPLIPSSLPGVVYDLDGTRPPYALEGSGHGHGVASILGGYHTAWDIDTNPQASYCHVFDLDDQDTKLLYGQGVSPWGRMASAKILGGWFSPNLEFLEPADFAWTLRHVYDQTAISNSGVQNAHPMVITNSSLGLNQGYDCTASQGYAESPVNTEYDWYAKTYDLAARDCKNEYWFPGSGSNPMLCVVAAGNDGFNYAGLNRFCNTPTSIDAATSATLQRIDSAMNTIWSPGMAKNILTVGGSETFDARNERADLCPGYSDSYLLDQTGRADDADDVWRIASKGIKHPSGPRAARVKPDLVAPAEGMYVNLFKIGLATCSPTPAPGDPPVKELEDNAVAESSFPDRAYYRGGGTSSATPAVAGAAQILALYLNQKHGLQNPSPAFMKAWLINTSRMLRGDYSGPWNGSTYVPPPLPSPYQGWGRVNLDMAMDPVARFFVDQSHTFTQNGQQYVRSDLRVADASKPLRVTLVWTDYTDQLATPSLYHDLVNDLDLEVEVNGTKYAGNFFRSTAGHEDDSEALASWPATRDQKNNVECVFLDPPGTMANITVRVKARQLLGDAVGTIHAAPPTQDFALVIYNADEI